MICTTRLELRNISELRPYANNARVHSPEQIAQLRASMREFGFVAPVLIDTAGNILAGHGRVDAAQLEGFEQAPCVLVEHLTDTQRQAYILADNRLAELASWDRNTLNSELLLLEDAGFDIALTGFAPELVEPAAEAREDNFEFTIPQKPVCQPGQLWALGAHRLLCGDATKQAAYSRLMNGLEASLLLTDPPYFVDYVGGTDKKLKIANDALPEAEAIAFLESSFSCAKACLKPGAAFYVWGGDGAAGYAFRQGLHKAGLRVRQHLVWVKNSIVIGRQDYQWQHEAALCGEVALPADEAAELVYGWNENAAHLWTSDRKQSTVLYCDRPSRSAQHPTMKPVKLFGYLIRNSSRRGGIVLDPFAGSGTTLIACEQLSRVAYCMDIDPAYCDVIIQRWEALTGQKAVLIK